MTRRRSIRVIVAAGGTGGHMYPAHVVARELEARGHDLMLITDRRGMQFRSLFKGLNVYKVPAATFAGRGIWGRIVAVFELGQGVLQARELLKGLRPAIVVGFGGYPSLPVLVAAMTLGIPTCIHEQNAVLGRVNRLLSSHVGFVALSFNKTRKLSSGQQDRQIVTGNPVRPEIVAIGEASFPPLDDTRYLNLLVVGGSQGARILSEVVPAAVSALPKALRRRLNIVQQCRQEDIESVRETYRQFGVKAELTAFIEDMPAVLENIHLVIARAGASTVTELAAAGRPAIYVPLPGATDDHQTANCVEVALAGGAWMIRQRDFNTASVAKLLQGFSTSPERLRKASEMALINARPHAAKDLADLIEQFAIAGGTVPEPGLQNKQRTAELDMQINSKFAGLKMPRAMAIRENAI